MDSITNARAALAHCRIGFQNGRMISPPPDLQVAATVLEGLAAGQTPDRTDVLNAALILSTYCLRHAASRDLLDAAAGLEWLATGEVLDLDATGRQRALKLAQIVRQAVP